MVSQFLVACLLHAFQQLLVASIGITDLQAFEIALEMDQGLCGKDGVISPIPFDVPLLGIFLPTWNTLVDAKGTLGLLRCEYTLPSARNEEVYIQDDVGDDIPDKPKHLFWCVPLLFVLVNYLEQNSNRMYLPVS